jgi:hypothetical protein
MAGTTACSEFKTNATIPNGSEGIQKHPGRYQWLGDVAPSVNVRVIIFVGDIADL